MSRGTKTIITILSILVLLSLALNGYLLWQWWSFQQQTRAALTEIETTVSEVITQAMIDLEAFENSTLDFEFQVRQDLPVEVEIPFNESINVPIQTTIPISQEIETTIMIDPFQAGLEIPTDIVVPVDMEVPLDLNIPVAIERPIPISTTVSLDIDVPIAIEVSDTDLAPYLERLRLGLGSLEDKLSTLE
jgi:hypothetical protein